MEIINLFYELARQHKQMKGFRYGKTSDKGAGTDIYPLTWVDDPISGQSPKDAVIRYTVNVDILGLPEDDNDVLNVQSAAFLAGLSYREQIKTTAQTLGFSVESLSFISLRQYYDDNAAGFRFTYYIVAANPLNRCESNYDPSKQFTVDEPLPDFKTENPNGCAVFNDKGGLPNFSI